MPVTSAALRRAGPPGTSEPVLLRALLVIAGAGWALTGARMGGMDMGPGTELGGLGWFVVAWVTMMAAMMLPSMAPAVLAYARVAERRAAGESGLFVAGYLAAWCAAGLAGYVLVEGVRTLDLGFLAFDEGGRLVAAGTIAAAALYQLAPVKDRCLRHCRSPESFLRRHWRSGRRGALRVGMEHGAFCVGCCWALMATLFALGVMNVAMMAFVAGLVATEKLLPWRAASSRGIAVLLALLALAVALAPEHVPGLSIPASHETMEEMS